MTRTATFTGTILIVAGFVATAIAAESEDTEFRDAAGIGRSTESFAVDIVTLEGPLAVAIDVSK